jgi:hypothetical protein
MRRILPGLPVTAPASAPATDTAHATNLTASGHLALMQPRPKEIEREHKFNSGPATFDFLLSFLRLDKCGASGKYGRFG